MLTAFNNTNDDNNDDNNDRHYMEEILPIWHKTLYNQS